MRHEGTTEMNARIARIEREANVLGIALTSPTKNSREFSLNAHRTIRFRTKGKGTMLIEARHSGVLESSAVMRDDKIKDLLRKAAEANGN